MRSSGAVITDSSSRDLDEWRCEQAGQRRLDRSGVGCGEQCANEPLAARGDGDGDASRDELFERPRRVRLSRRDLPKPRPGSIQTSSTPPSSAALARSTSHRGRRTYVALGGSALRAMHRDPSGSGVGGDRPERRGHVVDEGRARGERRPPRSRRPSCGSTPASGPRAWRHGRDVGFDVGSVVSHRRCLPPRPTRSRPRATISSGEPIIPPRCRTPMTSGDTALSVLVPVSPSRR